MFKRVIILLCVFTLISFVSCKKKDDAAPGIEDQLGCEFFGTCDDGGGGDYLPTDTDPICGDAECNGDETVESCPADCDPGLKNNKSSSNLSVSVDGEEDELKEADTIIATVKMKSFTGAATIDYEIDVADIVEVDIEEEFDESNKVKYTITGLEPGEAVIKFKATNDANIEEIFEKELKVTVIENIVENKSSVDYTEILAKDEDLTLTLKSKGGSEEDLEWSKTVVNYIADDLTSTPATAAQYKFVKSTPDESSNTITEAHRFLIVGKYELVTSVTDPVFAHTAEKKIEITVRENAAINVYTHTIATGELVAMPDTKIAEMQFHYQEVVVAVTGYDDFYSCTQLGNLVATENGDIKLKFEALTTPIVIQSKAVYCKLTVDLEYNETNEDLIGSAGVAVSGVKISIIGDYSSEVQKDFSVKVVLNPSDVDLKLTVLQDDSLIEDDDYDNDGVTLKEYLTSAIDYYQVDNTDIESFDVPIFASLDVIFEIGGGVPPYKWKMTSDVPDVQDNINNVTITSYAANNTWEFDKRPKIVGDGTNDAILKKKVKDNHYYQIEGKFAYNDHLPVNGLHPSIDPHEIWTLTVEDSTGKKFEQKFQYNIKWPTLEKTKLSSMTVRLDVTDVTDTDGSSVLEVRFKKGSETVGKVSHKLDDCGDYMSETLCEEEREVEFLPVDNNDDDEEWKTGNPSNTTLSNITEVVLYIRDPTNYTIPSLILDCDVTSISIYNTYYVAIYWDDGKEHDSNPTDFSGLKLNDNYKHVEENLIENYMLDQLGFKTSNPHHVWRRKAVPIEVSQ